MSATEKFTGAAALEAFMREKGSGALQIAYHNLEGYEGMVLGIGIIYDTDKKQYDLSLEWITFGLDPYAENLMESYLYRFRDLQLFLTYLHEKYGIAVTDIQVRFSMDHDRYPSPFKDADKKDIFEKDWQRFQDDFWDGKFLDPSLELIDSSLRLGRFVKKKG